MSEKLKPRPSPTRPALESMRLLLAWDDPAQREELIAFLAAHGRQTMNLRMMPTARVLTLSEPGGHQRVGICGLDDQHDPSHPELFSLYVDEDYRAFRLGHLLETARAQFLLSRGHEVGYVRMEKSSNAELLRYRLKTGIFTALSPSPESERYTALCRHCELFERSCVQQEYLKVDLRALAARGAEKLGALDLTDLPLVLELSGSTFRPLRPARASE